MSAVIDAKVWDFFRAAYLRRARPTVAQAYRQTAAFAAGSGMTVPEIGAFRRKLASTVRDSEIRGLSGTVTVDEFAHYDAAADVAEQIP